MDSRVSDLVQSYTRLASSLLERWSELASRTASKVDAGAYDASSAAEDVVAGSWLATEAAGLWAAQTLSAYATLAGYKPEPNIQTSEPFKAAKGAKLDLRGALVRGPGPDNLPPSAISIQPPQLGPDQTEFTLEVDATGYRGGTYVGVVNATTDAGTKPLNVWISIP
jgi:hypothetical protein